MMIGSIGESNKEVIGNILTLHIPNNQFDLDPAFSKGAFYKGLQEPLLKYDIQKQEREDVRIGDCTNLPLSDNRTSSIMFDPPFCFGIHGKTLQNISAKRFTMFADFHELENMYKKSLVEFYRILKYKGILVFKCQDYTDGKTTMTHCFVYNWALSTGFYAKDLFILVNKNRIWNPNLKQRHARKTHSYFWIFKKKA